MSDNLFYERMKNLSKNQGKSLNQIEKELGYSRNSLNNYKSKQMPSALRLLEIAEYLKVSPEYLFGKSNIQNAEETLENFFQILDGKEKLNMCVIAIKWLKEINCDFSNIKYFDPKKEVR